MTEVAEREAEAQRLEAQVAEVCGLLHATTGRLVELIARVLETEAWQGWGIRSAEQWVAWKCGVSPVRARTLVSMARGLGELPETKAALEAGELSEDQAAVVCRRAPAHVDRQVATLARSATVTQLRRVLSSYTFEGDEDPPQEQRRVSFGYTDEGSWSLSALLPADEGALWELPHGLRRFLSCDSRVRPVLESGGKAVSVGRAFRAVPERTRVVVEDRDRGCRVPGCERSRWLHVHHLTHWEDGGTSDTSNLACLCSRHHRLHHQGKLGIRGNADEPGGLVFTDERGRLVTGNGPPTPPNEQTRKRLNIPSGAWTHPTGETLDWRWVHFAEPRAG